MRTSRRMLRQVRRAVLVAFLFSGCINVLMLATPLYTLQVFETVVPLGSIETLALLTVITAVAIGALALIEIVRDMILLRSALWLDHGLGQHMLENGLKLGTPEPELAANARALQQVRQFMTGGGLAVLFDAPWIPLFLVALTLLNPLIGLVAVVSAVTLLAAAVLQTKLTTRLLGESARANERSAQWWTAVTGNPLLTGALGLSSGASRQWESFNRANIAGAYSVGKRTSVVKAMARMVRMGSQIALYGLGAWLVVRGEMTPGALVASAILLARALAPLEQLVGAIRASGTALDAYRRLRALPADATVPHVGQGEEAPPGHIRLAGVTYYYPARRTPALRSINLTIRPGQCLGIAGANGSGKSTLAAVLAGAAMPTTGSADLDGLPIAKWQRGEGAPPVGYLPDDPQLIEGTVHANICRFGDATLLAVARAGMRAGVHETLAALPQGYDTNVGVNGSALSLRERRSVAIARALFGAPKVVVFDEPELGLDGGSLKALAAMLRRLKDEGASIVLATQDPRLLALADHIVVMNAGAIEVRGTPAEISRQLALAAAKVATDTPAVAGVH